MERDLVVVGAGSGGYAAALHAAHLGRRVTLVDRRGVQGLGGVCLHEGCVPTKALLRIAGEASRAAGMSAAGVVAGSVTVDLAAFQVWKTGLIARLTDGIRRLLTAAGVDVVAGTARFTAPDTLEIATTEDTLAWRFVDAVLAVGSRPLAPPDLPIDGATVLDSTAALELTQRPASLVVVGGGSVGMELGTTFAKLGSKVTIVEREARLMPMFDPLLVRPLQRHLAEIGVDVITAATVTDHADTTAVVSSAAGEQRVAAERILAGVGRRPNTDLLDLAAAGIPVDGDGFVQPGADLRVAEHVAAVGDITPGAFHAHKATAQAVVAAQALCGQQVTFDPATVPLVLHSEPELASVGVAPSRARDPQAGVRLSTFGLGASGWAVASGAPLGAAHVVVDERDTVVGVHLVGPHATELIGAGALAVTAGVGVEQLSQTIFAHPTLSEQIGEAAHAALGLPLHIAPRPARRP